MLLPFLAGLLVYKKLNGPMRIFFFTMTVLVLFEVVLAYMTVKGYEKFWVFNIAFITQPLLVNFFCYRATQSIKLRNLIVWITVGFFVLWCILIISSGIRFTNPYLIAFSTFSTALSCAFLMYDMVAYQDINVFTMPEFIGALSFLIYCAMAGIIFALLDHQPKVAEHYPNFKFYRNYIHYFVNVFVNLISTYAFLCLLLKRK
jgi:type IV secretory pathway TrbL component